MGPDSIGLQPGRYLRWAGSLAHAVMLIVVLLALRTCLQPACVGCCVRAAFIRGAHLQIPATAPLVVPSGGGGGGGRRCTWLRVDAKLRAFTLHRFHLSRAVLTSDMDNLLHLVHIKVLAADLLSLTIQHTSPPAFLRSGRTVTRTELVGIVVSRDRRDKFLRFLIDDGTGCVPCILWLNHQYLNASTSSGPSDADPTAEMALKMSEEVRLGTLLRVRGKIATYHGEIQITVRDVVLEKDPNAEVLHWLQCVRLAKECYDLPPPSAQGGT